MATGRQTLKIAAITLVVVWICGWVFLLRNNFVDGAFVHLRYASNLSTRHILAFNPGQRSYGASSLGYVGLLALLYPLVPGVWLTKIVSVGAYLALVGLGLWFAYSKSEAWWVLLIPLVTPMGVRWLTAGMETSFATLLGFIVAVLAYRNLDSEQSLPTYLAFVLLGSFIETLRVEMSFVVAGACAAIFVARLEKIPATKPFARRVWMVAKAGVAAGHMALGALGTIVLVRGFTGQWLPDTAAAKAGLTTLGLFETTKPFVASCGLGIGLCIGWIVSGLMALRAGQFARSVLIAINIVFPLLVFVAVVRGQVLQVRYFLPELAFCIAFNLLVSAEALTITCERFLASVSFRGLLVRGIISVVAIDLMFESLIVGRIAVVRSNVVAQFAKSGIGIFRGQIGLAHEVGIIGWYSGGDICDIDGLVGGRSWALMTRKARVAACAERPVAFAFLNEEQMAADSESENMRKTIGRMRKCGSYALANASGPDVHYLFVDPTFTAWNCEMQ
jgi:hypothetical protein